jgi:xanthine dehydrogenase YagS FAD-binding subunit
MQAFTLIRPRTLDAALAAGSQHGAKYIAGGSDLMQLGKDDVEQPRQIVDLEGLLPDTVTLENGSLRLGALARMSDVAANADVRRAWPAVSEALLASASQQIRNMGTMGGNLLQRTRCSYFRDTGFACNKRAPGSGCPAIPGENRHLGVVGISANCIATHPSDMPVALMAMDASVELLAPSGIKRTVPLAEFYRLPGDTPHIETNLLPGEVIAAVIVPPSPAAAKSRYLKIRDRASFEFAVVSAAVALSVEGGVVRQAGIALGGVAPRPWRLPQVEAALQGQPATDDTFRMAAALASQDTHPASGNAFKVKLMQRAVLRGLQMAAA